MDEELRKIESKLEEMTPLAMPDDMLARMEQAMERWQEFEPAEDKIVPFQAAPSEKSKLGLFSAWASAAAVALVAAASYVVFSGDQPADNVIAEASASIPAITASGTPSKNIQQVIPASHSQFRTKVTQSADGMITYDAQGRPLRVMQIGFEDEVIVRDRHGNVHKVKQPRVEYYAVPVEVY